MEHQHVHKTVSDEKCECGATICSAPDPKGAFGCTLTKYHSGPCMNTWTPSAGKWFKDEYVEQPS